MHNWIGKSLRHIGAVLGMMLTAMGQASAEPHVPDFIAFGSQEVVRWRYEVKAIQGAALCALIPKAYSCESVHLASGLWALTFSSRTDASDAEITFDRLKNEGVLTWWQGRSDGGSLRPAITYPLVPGRSAQEVSQQVASHLAEVWEFQRIYSPVRLVQLAVIDSGLNYSDEVAPFLPDGIARCGWDARQASLPAASCTDDLVGHGSLVARVAVKALNGDTAMAPRLVAYRVMERTPAGIVVEPAWLARALFAAVDHGAQVINLSIASHESYAVVREAIDYALVRRVAVVAASGNVQGPPLFPANVPGVIGVAALDESGSLWTLSGLDATVKVLAPGVGVDVGDGRAVTGTSFAAPLVSASIAALLARGYESCGIHIPTEVLARPSPDGLTRISAELIKRFEIALNASLPQTSDLRFGDVACSGGPEGFFSWMRRVLD